MLCLLQVAFYAFLLLFVLMGLQMLPGLYAEERGSDFKTTRFVKRVELEASPRGDIAEVHGIALDLEGHLIVTDPTSNRVIRFTVEDQGLGIPEVDLNNLLEFFGKERDKLSGGESSTGLGLAICEEIVKRHGGKIVVESLVGKGSCFRVFLPIQERRGVR